MAPRGRFIVLEGIDGAGTTTQARRLCRWLEERGRRAWLTREPSDGPIGKMLRRALEGRLHSRSGAPLDGKAMALLFAADRIDHLRDEIEPKLKEGYVVISDRYVLSSLAYQSQVAPLDWVEAINALARPPDLTVFIDVPAKVALERRRGRKREERYDALPLQRLIARRYRALVREGRVAGPLVAVDGRASVDAVHEAICEAVRRLPGLCRL